MAYSSTNPIQTILPRFGSGPAVHIYKSTHAHGAIEATGFFADGKRHGLQIGDALLAIAYSESDGSSAATWHVVSGSTAAISAASPLPASAYEQAFNVTVSPAST